LPQSLPATDAPALIVIEGLIDYLDRNGKQALFTGIRGRVPGACLLIDAQNSWLLNRNNKRTPKATGSQNVRFAWAPRDPRAFYGRGIGYEIAFLHPLLPELMRRRWPLTAWLPMPKTIREGYTLFQLRPSMAEA
jgi:O-methyltransferase involved in polyketide biosynthesis